MKLGAFLATRRWAALGGLGGARRSKLICPFWSISLLNRGSDDNLVRFLEAWFDFRFDFGRFLEAWFDFGRFWTITWFDFWKPRSILVDFWKPGLISGDVEVEEHRRHGGVAVEVEEAA